jgi:hypothetical protein
MDQAEQAVPVTQLGLPELDRVRQQLQADVENLVDSHNALGRAAARAEAAERAVAALAESKTGAQVQRYHPTTAASAVMIMQGGSTAVLVHVVFAVLVPVVFLNS